jgi:hypothetical protein
MRLIQHNPYRTIGLLVGATAREQERQIKRLKHFVEAAVEAEADWSFPFLGELNRTIETVNDAASKLNLDSDKMNAALFWFYNGNPITDEPAFEALKDGNPKLAIEIWRKLVGAQGDSYNEVTKRNASAFHNLSILYLQLSGVGVEALQLGLRYLESQFFNDLREKATDETYKISKKELQLIFLNKLNADGGNDSVRFCEVISQIEFSAKEDFLKELIQSPIEQLEKKIDEANTQRKTNKANAIDAGEALYKEAVLILGQVKSIAGESDFRYTSIADKVANEILQCSIDYWNFSQQSGSDTNFVEKCRKLAVSSDEIAIGKPTRLRISENLGVFKQRADKEL